MKKPIFNEQERKLLLENSLNGDLLRLEIAWIKFKRQLNKHWLVKIFNRINKQLCKLN